VNGWAIGAVHRWVTALEISSPQAVVVQGLLYRETGHSRHERPGARMAELRRDFLFAVNAD